MGISRVLSPLPTLTAPEALAPSAASTQCRAVSTHCGAIAVPVQSPNWPLSVIFSDTTVADSALSGAI